MHYKTLPYSSLSVTCKPAHYRDRLGACTLRVNSSFSLEDYRKPSFF